MLPDEPHVRVTLDQIYGTLLEVKQMVTEDRAENRNRDRQVDRHEQQIADHDVRMDKVEQNRPTRDELEQFRKELSSKQRWAIGLALTCIGLVLTIFGIFAKLWVGLPG